MIPDVSTVQTVSLLSLISLNPFPSSGRVAEEEEEGEWLLAADILQRIQKASKMKISSGQVNYFGRILQRLGVKSFRKTRGVYYHVVAVGQG